jgi:hypothetical protein
MSAQALAAAATNSELPLPDATTLATAAKFAQQQDKPIMMDYYADTVAKRAFIGVDKETDEKILVKNREEFTSLIKKIGKAGKDFLVMTENSIYIVSGTIEKKIIGVSKMLQEVEDF